MIDIKDTIVSFIYEQRKGHQRKRTKERENGEKVTFVGFEPTPSSKWRMNKRDRLSDDRSFLDNNC